MVGQIAEASTRTTKTGCFADVVDGGLDPIGVIESNLFPGLDVPTGEERDPRRSLLHPHGHQATVRFAAVVAEATNVADESRIYAGRDGLAPDMLVDDQDVVVASSIPVEPLLGLLDAHDLPRVLADELALSDASGSGQTAPSSLGLDNGEAAERTLLNESVAAGGPTEAMRVALDYGPRPALDEAVVLVVGLSPGARAVARAALRLARTANHELRLKLDVVCARSGYVALRVDEVRCRVSVLVHAVLRIHAYRDCVEDNRFNSKQHKKKSFPFHEMLLQCFFEST